MPADKSATLRVWSPGIVHGPLQTEDYARALLTTYPGVSPETSAAVQARYADLVRCGRTLAVPAVGSIAIMASQMRREIFDSLRAECVGVDDAD
jgi:hypothetical protein